ncbi:protein phosphatase 2C domain-containing protein [Aureivirga sp. CE67]|uniref:protein phosphatase 2C domain-containing protein n=1 Tax=Aureivirga sp. CE67 TaxID=1788983 RepID=UPI0018CB7A8B|nr:protein phosphatase 2C domain-containing protein [Aureivirga sp. CE67]
MTERSLLKIGDFHENNCEDFLVSEKIGSKQKLIAVMDGCTMGKESSFASMLVGKTLRKISKDKFYTEFIEKNQFSLEHQLKSILEALFKTIRNIQNELNLDELELLTTLIIGVLDFETQEAELITIGDGMIYHDGKITEYEQDDKPDYFGYHLSENFETWYLNQNQKLHINNFKDLSICTDGIFSFKNLKTPDKSMNYKEIIHYLLEDQIEFENELFFENKMRSLENDFQQKVTDDIAIIRIKN